MAEIRARKRGNTWSYVFEAAKVDGKRKQKSKGGFRTKKEALEAGAKAFAEYNNAGTEYQPSEISVADYMDYWMKEYVELNGSLNTYNAYHVIIENHIKPKWGDYKLKNLTSSTLQTFLNDISKNGYAKNMMTNIKCVLTGSLAYASDTLRLILDTPAGRLKLPSKLLKEKKERIVLSSEQMDSILTRFPEDSNFYIAIMLGYHCGLRISETYGLTWDNIDFKQRTLTVEKALNYDGRNKKWYYSNPKTKTSSRTILLGSTILNALRKHFIKHNENKLKYGEYFVKQYINTESVNGRKFDYITEHDGTVICKGILREAVCTKENGSMHTKDTFKYASRVIHYELGIAEFDYHTLRHTHATILVENGANIKDVQERLGHTNIETTLNTYTHNTDKMKEESIDIFERALNRKMSS